MKWSRRDGRSWPWPSRNDADGTGAAAGTGGSGARADVVGLLLATQSVTLMNQFELGDLVVVERRDGAAVFERPDPGRLSEWLAKYSLGELWEENLLGGRPRPERG